MTKALGEWPTVGPSLVAGPGPARGGLGRRRIRDRAAPTARPGSSAPGGWYVPK